MKLTFADAIEEKQFQESQPAGFYARQGQFTKRWEIRYKLTKDSCSELIQSNLTEKQAKKKVSEMNLILEKK